MGVALFIIIILVIVWANLKQPPSAEKCYADGEKPPLGYQIFMERIHVAGTSHRKKEVIEFANSQNSTIEFERDPQNRYDKNAIKIIGLSVIARNVKRWHLGYVPKELAAAIIEGGYYNEIKLRLSRTYIGKDGKVSVQFQVLGQKGKKNEFWRNYDEYRSSKE